MVGLFPFSDVFCVFDYCLFIYFYLSLILLCDILILAVVLFLVFEKICCFTLYLLFFNLFAPLAQLVEHLTLNQGVRGSSPRWCTISYPPTSLVGGSFCLFAYLFLIRILTFILFYFLFPLIFIHFYAKIFLLSFIFGSLVKRLRLRPLTPATRVRFPYESPCFLSLTFPTCSALLRAGFFVFLDITCFICYN